MAGDIFLDILIPLSLQANKGPFNIYDSVTINAIAVKEVWKDRAGQKPLVLLGARQVGTRPRARLNHAKRLTI